MRGLGRRRGFGMGKGLGMGRGFGRGVGLRRQTNSILYPPKQQIQDNNLKAFVDEAKCIGCGVCVNVCRVGAITMNSTAKINLDKCIGCGDCINVCPRNAITLKAQYQSK